mmetsp:Transcript_35729/g.90136  ORF Transcript_35729/g.90136 Transcript_35729/m.90136 type:complete len:218 (-) Transcript_35729:343-996(-)
MRAQRSQHAVRGVPTAQSRRSGAVRPGHHGQVSRRQLVPQQRRVRGKVGEQRAAGHYAASRRSPQQQRQVQRAKAAGAGRCALGQRAQQRRRVGEAQFGHGPGGHADVARRQRARQHLGTGAQLTRQRVRRRTCCGRACRGERPQQRRRLLAAQLVVHVGDDRLEGREMAGAQGSRAREGAEVHRGLRGRERGEAALRLRLQQLVHLLGAAVGLREG